MGDYRGGEPIYVGGMLVGFIKTLSSGFEAVTGGGSALGRYNTAAAAARALRDAAFSPRSRGT